MITPEHLALFIGYSFLGIVVSFFIDSFYKEIEVNEYIGVTVFWPVAIILVICFGIVYIIKGIIRFGVRLFKE